MIWRLLNCYVENWGNFHLISSGCNQSLMFYSLHSLSVSTLEEDLARTFQINDSNCYIGLYEFAEHLKFSPMHDGIKRLFNVFQQVDKVLLQRKIEHYVNKHYLFIGGRSR